MFNSLVEISSYPWEFFDRSDLIIEVILVEKVLITEGSVWTLEKTSTSPWFEHLTTQPSNYADYVVPVHT